MITNNNQHIQNDLRHNPESISILNVEGKAADIHLTTEQLLGSNKIQYTIETSNTLADAKQKLEHGIYDMIFLDLALADSIGTKTLERMRRVNNSAAIVVITGSHDENLIAEIIQKGAQDYIHKDEFDIKTIDRTVRYAIERKKIETELQQLAYHDSLTKLPNRSTFMDRLDHSLENNRRNMSKSYVVVMQLDLDNFKSINDTLGHNVGDALLIQVSNRLRACVRNNDTVARLEGDKFIIFFEDVEHLNSVSTIAKKITNAISEPFLIDNKPVLTSTSIGVSSSYDVTNATSEIILKNSDTAMCHAKKKGGNNVGFFTRELQICAKIRNNLEKNLRLAIQNDELRVFFQPQINLETNTIYGAEALVRWNHREYGIIPPSGFIPALNETGLIIPATEWIIKRSLTLWQQWQRENIVEASMHLSINIPPLFINQANSYKTITSICSHFKVKNSQIEFELTEDTFMDITPRNIEVLTQLTEDGFRLAIDDFGTGYSSLGYIKAFPIDCLKLDRLFIKDIVESRKDEAIAVVMIELCKRIGANLIAEGVDTQEKLEKLQDLGCKIIQGFCFSKPLAECDFRTYMQDFKQETRNNTTCIK
jgi:diguanylate cyclase (GGDEF)-like protein